MSMRQTKAVLTRVVCDRCFKTVEFASDDFGKEALERELEEAGWTRGEGDLCPSCSRETRRRRYEFR